MLEPFFLAMEQWRVSRFIGESLWIFAVIQAFHLVFMVFLMGAVLMVNLRLMGGLRDTSIAQVARSARPWLIGGFLGMILTGVPQLMQNASREYYSEYFWRKMYFLLAALIVTALAVSYMKRLPESTPVSLATKLTAIASLLLWANVIMNGRLIGLFT